MSSGQDHFLLPGSLLLLLLQHNQDNILTLGRRPRQEY